MPWCDTCQRWHSPNALTETGDCPVCGQPAAAGRAAERTPGASPSAVPGDRAGGSRGDVQEPEEDEGTGIGFPWHFKLLVLCLAAYLGWRAVQGIEWVIGQF